MKGGIGQLMKQAQEMQANMQKAQEEMANIEVTGYIKTGKIFLAGQRKKMPE